MPPGAGVAMMRVAAVIWFREIRMPETLPPGTVIPWPPVPPLPADELESLPRNELEPPT